MKTEIFIFLFFLIVTEFSFFKYYYKSILKAFEENPYNTDSYISNKISAVMLGKMLGVLTALVILLVIGLIISIIKKVIHIIRFEPETVNTIIYVIIAFLSIGAYFGINYLLAPDIEVKKENDSKEKS